MATQNDFTEHVENANIHIMEEERTAWNAKADAHESVSYTHLDVYKRQDLNPHGIPVKCRPVNALVAEW